VLGKGLGAIFPDLVNDFDKKKPVFSCGIEELRPNRYQPRKNFNDSTQKQLIASLKARVLFSLLLSAKLTMDMRLLPESGAGGQLRLRA